MILTVIFSWSLELKISSNDFKISSNHLKISLNIWKYILLGTVLLFIQCFLISRIRYLISRNNTDTFLDIDLTWKKKIGLLISRNHFLVSRNRFLDIKKCYYFLISRIRFLDQEIKFLIKKYLINSHAKKSLPAYLYINLLPVSNCDLISLLWIWACH